MEKPIYNIEVKTIDGKTKTLAEYKGKTLLIVNTASKCGFTSQYKGLEELYEKYKNKNFVVLGFPCNQFAGQEPGNEEEIKNFCGLNYKVTFPMFAKVNVNGNDAHPLFKYLKEQKKGFLCTEFIKWNFTKFLVDKDGEVVKRFAPQDKPEEIGEFLNSF
ncbi:MAG: glutathione peroxidase [Bdellovibrionota bacterium]